MTDTAPESTGFLGSSPAPASDGVAGMELIRATPAAAPKARAPFLIRLGQAFCGGVKD